ncbi:MAG TPA: glycerophosphodiester phosphodiesterase family protein [Bacillota bacterium]|nr:glycerophosphodiester phosphodiesterase family protein [Bacillota bacterium]HPF42245.1 glycerophosphodiester phosphodiesterase family protein [Bacillota bacterium]HPJ85733.1 glycerophosphodiester phosphodiesterase family protein [Bacillota bacterium]HPQ61630.1 glycerophosphodiester phosphodiesterase family protein [Bacillota bacterium]HRX91537.1 glycerophosphodiester phosphodiesterase family protein [Candidatus Izemoplasmatales bacterium]
MNTIKIDKYYRGMIAHRGLSGIETENTINAYIAAANRSYFGIECDVYASKDDKLILTHDDTLLRMGLLNVYIPGYKYEEIRRFTLIDRKTGHLSDTVTIPLLKDYLAICMTYQKHAFIELKSNLTNAHVDQVIDEVRKYHRLEDTSIISFHDKYLVYLRKNYPDMSLYLLSGTADEKTLAICEKNRLGLDAEWHAITETVVKRLHLTGLKVTVYTVDDKNDAEKLIKMGVDYITTNILE